MSHGKRCGFTLVELLVVIGIIALLISILLPTLNKARQQAVSIQCLSNLKQLGNAAMIYANDNQGFLPLGMSAAGGGSTTSKLQEFAYWYSTAPSVSRGAPQAVNDGANNTVALAMAKYLGVKNPTLAPAAQAVAVPELYCPANNMVVDGKSIDTNYFLTDSGGAYDQSMFKYDWLAGPFTDLTDMKNNYPAAAQALANQGAYVAAADLVAATIWVGKDQWANPSIQPNKPSTFPAPDGTAQDRVEYMRKVGTKNAADILICADRTSDESYRTGPDPEHGYCLHGPIHNGWANELYGDFHAYSVPYNSWKLRINTSGSDWHWY